MTNRISYAFVGLFVLVLGTAWLGISLWLTLGDFSTQYKRYLVYIDESVSGLYLDAPVKYRGVDVGKVVGIDLNPSVVDQVQLTLELVSTAPIREDTVAVLSVQGLTGIAFVELRGGSPESPVLESTAGEEYPIIRSAPSFFARLDMTGTELMANINALSNKLSHLLDNEGVQAVREILVNVSTITGAIAARDEQLKSTLSDTARLMQHSADAAQEVQPLLVQIDATAESIEKMADEVAAASGSFNRYVSSSGTSVESFSQQTLPELGALINEMRQLADSMRHVSRRLEDEPRTFIYGRDLEVPGPGE